MTIDPGQPDGPPVIDIRTFSVSGSLPRIIVGLVIGIGSLALVGWLVIGSVFGAPWFIAIPMSALFGAGFVAWQVKRTWRGYAVSAVLWLGGFAWFGWWYVETQL